MPKQTDRTQIMKDLEGYMKPEDVQKLIEASTNIVKGRRNKLLLRTLWETGARVSEIVGKKVCKVCGKQAAYNSLHPSTPHCECSKEVPGLERNHYVHLWPLVRSNILVDEGTLLLYTLKKKQEMNPPRDPMNRNEPPKRYVDVTDDLVTNIIRYVEDRDISPDERIFQITKERVGQIVKKVAEEAGVRTVSGDLPHSHTFRHSHAIQYMKGDSSVEGLKKLRDRFQHSSINTTTFYLQFTREGEKEKIEELFGMED